MPSETAWSDGKLPVVFHPRSADPCGRAALLRNEQPWKLKACIRRLLPAAVSASSSSVAAESKEMSRATRRLKEAAYFFIPDVPHQHTEQANGTQLAQNRDSAASCANQAQTGAEMATRKHRLDSADAESEPASKRAKLSSGTCARCNAALPEAVEVKTKQESKSTAGPAASAAAPASTICAKCATSAGEWACTECKAKLSEESKQADGTCNACASTCSRCAEEDNLLFPRSKYPLVRQGELARVCHYCQRARESKEGDVPPVTCGKCSGERQFAVTDIIAHYQSEHAGFSADELPVGFICCPACPRTEAIKSGQVFLPVVGGRVDRRLLAHSQDRWACLPTDCTTRWSSSSG